MLRCTVLYPNNDGAHFDFGYYLSKHIPLANDIMGGRFVVTKGLPGEDGSAPAFLCVASIDIGSGDELAGRLRQRGGELGADVRNYTNVAPIIQMTEILS